MQTPPPELEPRAHAALLAEVERELYPSLHEITLEAVRVTPPPPNREEQHERY